VRREHRVSETGDNLSTVVHTLFSERDPALDEIVDLLRACVPTVEELNSPITAEGRTYIALKEESVPSPVGSWGLSDGTLLALAIATALSTPQPPSLVALEAPDIELHPYVMETLAEMLKLASEKTQVIATTHSPYLLDYLPPESFVVVEKTEGATTCRPLKGEKDIQRVMQDLGAGEAWVSGHLGGVP
jgi:predicted ATPase